MSDLIWLSEAQMRRIEPYFSRFPTVLRGSMIVGSSAVSSSSSGTACGGAMRPLNTDRPRRSITALSGGAGLACSTRSSPPSRPKAASPTS